MKGRICVLLAGLWAGSAFSADLLETYRQALAHDASYQSARAQRDAGLEKRIQGRAGLLPTLGLSANSSWNQLDYKAGPARIDPNYNSNSYALQLTQPLFRWDNWVANQQGELSASLAETRFQIAQQDLILRVSKAYFDVLDAQDALAAVQNLRTAAGQQLELSKKSFEVGTVTITDVHEAQSRYDLAYAQEIAAVNTLEVTRQKLATLTGAAPEGVAGLRKGVSLESPQPADIQSWVGSAEEQAFEVQAAKIGLQIAEKDVERSRAGHYPTLDLVASHQRNRSISPSALTPQSAVSNSDSVGVQFNLPLYAGGAVSSRVRENIALQEKSRADLDDAKRSAALAARQSYLGVTSGLAQVKALEAAEVSSRSSLEANQLGYEVGVRINIDVLNAQSQLADTTQKLAKARYDTLVSELSLKAATGSLDEAALTQVNALLQP